MRTKIAEIKLNAGQVGFYDELTNIHLTIASPYAPIYEGMNLSRIKASVASKRLSLISGSLSDTATPIIEMKAERTEEVKKAAEIIEERAKEVAKIVDETVVVETKEEVSEEIPEVENKKSKKKATKEEE